MQPALLSIQRDLQYKEYRYSACRSIFDTARICMQDSATRSEQKTHSGCYGIDIPVGTNDGKGQSRGRKIMYSYEGQLAKVVLPSLAAADVTQTWDDTTGLDVGNGHSDG